MTCCGEKTSQAGDAAPIVRPHFPATQCIQCAEKHISLASALAWECGYKAPNRQRVIGELAAAALHLCVEHKELADRVRAVRHLIQQRKEPEVQWDDLLTEMDKVVMADLEKDNQQST